MPAGGIFALEKVIAPPRIHGDSFVHQCPVCKKRFRYGSEFEPICTGPSESRDEHPPETMRLVRVDRRQVGPKFAESRALGPMILPSGFMAK